MKMLKSIAFSALLLTGTTAGAQSLDDVLATVNGTDVTLGDLLVARTQLPQQYQHLPGEALFDGLLTQVIQQQLLSETITEVPARLQLAITAETRALRAGEALSGISDLAVTDDAVQTEYQNTFMSQEMGQEYHAAHILVETEDKAKDIIAQLNDGADFAELAAEHSTGPSGPSGGDLGWFAKGVMVPAFEVAVIAMEPGAISEPVETQFGWHVIKLVETRDVEAPELEDVRAELENALRQQAIATYVEKLVAEADITRTEGVDPTVLGNLDLLDQ